MEYVIFAAFVAFVLFVIGIFTKIGIRSNWKHYYEGTHFSTSAFYKAVEDTLAERQVDGLKFDQQSFLESHVFSGRRVYLCIYANEMIVYVSAFPFGTGMFVSCWTCIKDESYLDKIPGVSKMLGRDRKNKSFYQMDSEAMYELAIHNAVVSLAEELTKEQGHRGLSEFEKQIKPGRQ